MAAGGAALAVASPARFASGEATSLIFSFPSGELAHPPVSAETPLGRKGSPRWPEEKVGQLKTLWGMGLSHGAIAKVMDLKRGSVSAKLDRLGLERARPVVDGRSMVAANARPRPAPTAMSAIPGARVSMLILEGCRAPTGYASGEHLFCDAPRKEGSSYCCSHHNIAYRGTT